MFEMMNKERSELGLVNRYRSLNCKKAAEWHLNYLMKYESLTGLYLRALIPKRSVKALIH
jgi:Uri superfamily endonuclease